MRIEKYRVRKTSFNKLTITLEKQLNNECLPNILDGFFYLYEFKLLTNIFYSVTQKMKNSKQNSYSVKSYISMVIIDKYN